MGCFVHLRPIGDVYVPGRLEDEIESGAPLRVFEGPDLRSPRRVFDFVRLGGVAVLLGSWEDLRETARYAVNHRDDLAGDDKKPRKAGPPGRSRRRREKERSRALERLAGCAKQDRLLGAGEGVGVPSLLEFLGEPAGATRGRPFLVPITEFQRLRKSLDSPVRVDPLDADLVVPDRVLAPISAESVALMGEALGETVPSLPPSPVILDMGCGSGSLSLLAALRTADLSGLVVATDVLPEALAATRLNRDRMVEAGRLREGAVEVTDGGDLFDPVEGRAFDLILFNAPWVTTPARSLPERSTHDEGQDLLRRFLEGAGRHLAPEGSILLEYSDHSGPRAIENLHRFAEGSGWAVRRQWKTRIQARRKSPKWERIFVFGLVHGK